jgi:exonuclease SbcC
MRPHHLRLTAFGPFAGTVQVDLDALASARLFLLHGPTGAGKTTLLDGLGFALFGRVPGVRNHAKRLRSDHAAPGDRTEVQLEVTLAGRRMRITRSPQQERPKARGSGTTTDQASVLLEELVDGAWVTLSTRVGEADAEIADLVGMSAEQFFQVVLLPQGDFAQFLRASSADRAEVLQKLFATERFADVEAWLAAGRRQAEQACAEARRDVSEVLARIAETAGLDEIPEDAGLAWASELLSHAAELEDFAAVDVASATALRDARRTESEAAVRLAGLQSRRRAALIRRDELEAQQPFLHALQAELDRAERASEVRVVLEQVTQRRASRDAALTAEAAARAATEELGWDENLDATGLRALAATARERCGQLEALKAVDTDRREALLVASRGRDELADILAAGSHAELQLASHPARREAATTQQAMAREAAAQLPVLRAERDRLVALRPDLVLLGRVRDRLAGLAEEHLSARETAVALTTKANDLRTASVNSMIARLAFQLEEGCPCPVCGSPDHPDKSLLLDEGVSTDDEDRAWREAEAAQAVVAELAARLAADQARLADLESRLEGLTLEGVDAVVADFDLQLGVLEAQSAQEAPATAALADLDHQRVELQTLVVAADEQANACSARIEQAEARAVAAQRQLDEALAGATDLAAALARAAQEIDVAELATASLELLAAAQTELDNALTTAESACADKGFGGADQAAEAFRDEPWRIEARARLREVADASAAVKEALADPELDVDLEQAAPVESTTALLVEADETLTQAVGRHAEARQRRTGLERLVPELSSKLQRLEPLEATAREVRGLADLCAGQGSNRLRMTLTSFVLAARLEEVAAAASVRLLKMTQGRYSLVHTDGGARGGARSGLGLLARDGWSGKDRDTSTLSGGETFLASLALALGLADVVTAEAGGARIGALFVDEGFGTLDEDTLDEVMDVLDGLCDGGRIVGLVSHVSELRMRIPTQVHVTKTRTGSDLTLIGC